MRNKILKMGMLAGAVALFASGGVIHSQNQTAQQKPQAQVQSGQATPTGPSGMMGSGMMGGGMMGMTMNTMMGQHQQMSDNINKMMENMAAMQKEKDPTKMKSMMAQQSAMLEQMHSQMMQQGGTMQNMSGAMMQNCPMTGDTPKPSTK